MITESQRGCQGWGLETAAGCVGLKLRACHRYMTQSQKPDRRLDSKKQSAKNGQGTLALSSDHTATNRVAQPALHDLAVVQIDGELKG